MAMSGSILCVINTAIFGTMEQSINLLLWYFLFILLAILLCILVYRIEKFEKIMKSVVERFTIFAYFYPLLSLFSSVTIILANIIP